MERVSVAADGADPNGDSEDPSISSDGMSVAFRSSATNLICCDRGVNGFEVFERQMVLGATFRWSVDTLGGTPEFDSYRLARAADVERVVFTSPSRDLVRHHTFPGDDVFLGRLSA